MISEAPVIGDEQVISEAGERKLAHDMIAVHGEAAAIVARSNARSAALAGQAAHAKSWIRVLAIIQQQQKPTL